MVNQGSLPNITTLKLKRERQRGGEGRRRCTNTDKRGAATAWYFFPPTSGIPDPQNRLSSKVA